MGGIKNADPFFLQMPYHRAQQRIIFPIPDISESLDHFKVRFDMPFKKGGFGDFTGEKSLSRSMLFEKPNNFSEFTQFNPKRVLGNFFNRGVCLFQNRAANNLIPLLYRLPGGK